MNEGKVSCEINDQIILIGLDRAAKRNALQALLVSATDAVTQGQVYAFEKMNDALKPLFASQDAQEGVHAMLEKRLPKFMGK